MKDLIAGAESACGYGNANRSRKCKETEGDSPSVSLGTGFGYRLFYASPEGVLTIGLKELTFLDRERIHAAFDITMNKVNT